MKKSSSEWTVILCHEMPAVFTCLAIDQGILDLLTVEATFSKNVPVFIYVAVVTYFQTCYCSGKKIEWRLITLDNITYNIHSPYR